MIEEKTFSRKYVLMPDSFKGTLSAKEVCSIMKHSLEEKFTNCEIISIPMADGGEGTIDFFAEILNPQIVEVQTCDPYMKIIEGFYGRIDDTAIVELAVAAGLGLAEGNLNPLKTSTYGVGLIIKEAVKAGCKKIVLGIGGSCTNDGGAGMGVALGVKFYNEKKEEFIPVGETLKEIKEIDVTDCRKILQGVSIDVLCDVENPLYGENGAAYIFAPQKGASKMEVKLLDENLKAFAIITEKELGEDISELKGGGAAGGVGAGAHVFLGAHLKQGIDVLLDLIDFENVLENCHGVLTGEGKLDSQSLRGKVISGIGKRAKKMNVPVFAVVGSFEGDKEILKAFGIREVFIAKPKERKDEDILKYAKIDLYRIMSEVTNSLAKDT